MVGLKLDRPRFLSKSTIAFILFNVFMYIVFLVQFITTEVTDEHTKVRKMHVILVNSDCFILYFMVKMFYFPPTYWWLRIAMQTVGVPIHLPYSIVVNACGHVLFSLLKPLQLLYRMLGVTHCEENFAVFNMQCNTHSVLFKVYLSNIFTGFFVILMFLVLTLFLIYGVELFYKVWLVK